MKKTQVTDKNTQKPRRHQKNPDLVEKNPAVATLFDTGQRSFWRYNSDTLDRWERSDRCARGASNELFDSELAFYTPRVGLLDADWLQRISCGALIGWSLQRVTSLRHAVAAKVLLLGKLFSRLATE